MTGQSPGWGHGRPAGGVYWTKGRIVKALREFAAENEQFPTSSHVYNRIKKDRLDMPTSEAILKLWPTMARAWVAVGVERSRLTMLNTRWSRAEKAFLLEHAGTLRLKDIARRLNRSEASVKTMLGSKGLGIKARENQGWLSASRVAKEYACPKSRVYRLIAQGYLKATRDPHRKSWRIDPAAVEKARHLFNGVTL